MNKQADMESKLTLGNAANTALNPLAGMPGFGPLYYPGAKSDEGGIKPTLFHALALLATYGGGAYLARNLVYKSKIKGKSDIDRKKIASYINAEMPLVSPEPIRNPKKEIKEEMEGTEKLAMDKQAGLGNDLMATLIPVVALVGGFAGGTALADSSYRKQEKENDMMEEAQLKDTLDKLNYNKLKAVRNPAPAIEKTAGVTDAEAKARAEEYVNKSKGPHNIPGFMLALLGLTTGTVALGSAYFSKKYFDDLDENRAKIKALQKALQQKATVEAEQAPVVIPQMPSSVEKTLDASAGSPSAASSYASVDSPVRKKTLPRLPPPSMDVTDPSMRQLMIGG